MDSATVSARLYVDPNDAGKVQDMAKIAAFLGSDTSVTFEQILNMDCEKCGAVVPHELAQPLVDRMSSTKLPPKDIVLSFI